MTNATPTTSSALRGLLAAPAIVFIVLFFAFPLSFLMFEASAKGLHGIQTLLTAREFWTGLRNSLFLGLLAAILSVTIGFAVALRLSQMDERARLVWQFLIALPLTFSGLIVAYGFIITFGRAGFVTLSLQVVFGVDPVAFSQAVYSAYGLSLVYAYYLIPRVVMIITPALVNFDSAQLTAAESLGAPRSRVLLDILVPQLMPALVSSFCLVAAVAVGAYGTALALVGSQVNILPLQLFTMVSDAGTDFAVTASLGIVLMALCTSIMAIGELASGEDDS